MSSRYWDETAAENNRRFQFNFPTSTLAGKTIVLAGGTGGLGAATAALLLRERAQLVVGFLSNRNRAEEFQRAMREQFDETIALVEGDLIDSKVRSAYVQAIIRIGKPLAGAVIFPGDPARVAFEDLDRGSFMASLEDNYVGPVLLAKELGEAMEGNAGGSVVLMASMQAVEVFSSSLNYAGPKAALVHAARVLGQQWKNVRVNVVAPGATTAGMAEASVLSGKYDRYVESQAIPRFGRPEDIARAIRYFLEPDNYTTGQVLVVDGGLTLRRGL